MLENQETVIPESQPTPAPRRPKLGWILGLSLLSILLLGAAFLGGRLINGQSQSGIDLGGLPGVAGKEPGVNSVQIKVGQRPPELPETAPDVNGQIVSRSDNVLTLASLQGMGKDGGGVVMVAGSSGSSTGSAANPPVMPTPSGPQVEVVVTRDTKVYRDATFDDLKGGPPSTNMEIQQKAAEASLDEIDSTSMITVWGRKNGDRVIADVIFFSSPVVFSKKN